MTFQYHSSYDRAFKKLSPLHQGKAATAANAFIDFFQIGMRSKGLGLKKLHKNFWEIRAGLGMRILILLEKNTATFIFVGNHDQIRRFLKNY